MKIWNPWKHLRIAGALVILAGALMSQFGLTLIGLLIQYTGIIGGLDLLERKFDILTEEMDKKEEKN